MKLFHVTESERIAEILKGGLLLSKFKTGAWNEHDSSALDKVTPRIYLTDNYENLCRVDSDFYIKDWDLSVIEIEIPEEETEFLKPDEEYSEGVGFTPSVFHKDIPPDWITNCFRLSKD